MDFSKEKQKIRENINSLRFGQSASKKNIKDKEIRKTLFSLKEFKKAKTISIYVSKEEEVDTKNIIKRAFRLGKKIAVPSLKKNKPCMYFIDREENLQNCIPFFKTNKKTAKVNPKKLDLVVVPGVAFDERCKRLGRGKGYYDVFLEKIKGKVSLVALAYDFQVVKEILVEPHDIYMDKIITEKRIIISNL